MTVGVRGRRDAFTLALSRRGRGGLIGVLCFSLGSPAYAGKTGWFAGMTAYLRLSPSP